jgi:CBS domain-containing protein
MNVKDLMTAPVVAVSPEMPLRKVAAILAERAISGLPVVDERQHVLGVVSESDIVARERGGGSSGSTGAEPARKSTARTAGEAMTSPAITIPPDAPLAAAAACMLDNGVNRLPVVDGTGRLVGIVARADLVRVFARSDAELEREIRQDIVAGAFSWASPGYVRVEVSDGDVTLTGAVESDDVAELLLSMVERVPGVLSVRSELERT